MVEQNFFNQNGVTVTNARAIIGGTTYSMANITSVSLGMKPASRGGGILLAMIGGLIAAASDGGKGFGVLMLLVGIAWAVLAKADYIVKLGSAGGETHALTSTDKPFIEQVVGALNNAIIHRG